MVNWLLIWSAKQSKHVMREKLLVKLVMKAEMARKARKIRDYFLANWPQLSLKIQQRMSSIWSKEILQADLPSRAVTASFRQFCLCAARSSIPQKLKWQIFSKTKKLTPWFTLLVRVLDQNLRSRMQTMTRLSSWPMRIRTVLISRRSCWPSFTAICVRWLKQVMSISPYHRFIKCLKVKAKTKLSNMLGRTVNWKICVRNLAKAPCCSATKGLEKWMLISSGKPRWILKTEPSFASPLTT